MKKEKSQKVLLSGIAMVVLFILWTVAISLIDVQPIGPQNSSVGFATLNGFIHSLTGVHMAIYTVTDWLGLIPLCFILGFALLGLIFIDEIYLLFQHEYSANFLFTLWKRVRKYGAFATGITQNVDDLLQSHTARTMLANSEFLIMLNQASTDRLELAKLLNISDRQLSYITNVDAGHGLIKVGSSLVPFANKFPKNTKLYKLMTTKPGEGA